MKKIFLGLLICMSSFVQAQISKSEFGKKEELAYRRYIQALASDEFLGRKPFTLGETRTIAYLEEQFKELGLQPGNGDSYFQKVPMVEIKGHFQGEEVRVDGKNGKLTLRALTDIVGGTRQLVKEKKTLQAPLVFIGFGIDAPEYHWNDYAGVDVKGKIVVVLINDPGFYNPQLFRGKDMTYYGRWTYKFEEAARKGAAGVLIIHDTKPAAYDWSVVRSSWSKSKLYLQADNDNQEFCGLEGWISGTSAQELFKLSGRNDFASLLEQAKKPGFKAVPLSATLSCTIENEWKKSTSTNVAALLPGTTRADEYIVYSAHWDHFGVGEPILGDSIYNGAADNASGTAGLLSLAKKFKESARNQRSVLFLAVTGEEAGLLGSEYYILHPLFPLKKTVIDINMDVLQPFGKMKDIFLIGKGQSDADAYLEAAARKQNRTVRAVPDASNGWYYRSDHFSFAKAGVPAIYIEGGIQSLAHGESWGQAQQDEYVKSRYHKPQDEYSPSWDVSGTMADLELIFDAGRKLANISVFPVWKDGMYKKIRENQK